MKRCFYHTVYTVSRLIFVVFSLVFSNTVRANDWAENAVSWRLVGPGFSKHFSQVGARITGSTTVNDGGNLADIRLYQDLQHPEFYRQYLVVGWETLNLSRPAPLGGFDASATSIYGLPQDFKGISAASAPPTVARPANVPYTYVYPAGVAIYTGESANAYCERTTSGVHISTRQLLKDTCLRLEKQPYQKYRTHYTQVHPELGLERVERSPGSVTRSFGGAVIDSYDKLSVYAGQSRQITVLNKATWRVDAGVAGILWYRTIFKADGEMKRMLIPAILPTLSIESKDGIGLNLSYIPQIAYGGNRYSVNTLTAQVTWAIN